MGDKPQQLADVIRKYATLRMGYIRIETSRAGRHLPQPYGELDIGVRMTRVCRTRGSNRPLVERGQRSAISDHRLHREPSPYRQKKPKGSAREAD